VVKSGGVQWMSAGSGIVHSEAAGKSFVQQGGTLEIIQLWINLPGSLKMSAPTYYPFDQEELPGYDTDGVRLKVICGQVDKWQGPVKHPTPILACMLHLKPEAKVSLPTNPNWNTLLYQLAGNDQVNQTEVAGRQLVDFNPSEGTIYIECKESSRLLLVSGEPINEPLAQYGPFVMNKPEELNQAIEDYQLGKMGTL